MSEALAGRRILITGGSRGIGHAVAKRAADEGASVVVAARDRDTVDEAVHQLKGERHLGVTLDVSDMQSWPGAMAAVDTGGPLHGLVAAAGVLGPIGAIDAIAPEEFASTLAINTTGVALAMHHALPRLERAGGGAMVAFSGGGGTAPLARYDAYAASKAAVVRLTENVAVDVASRGVTVNAVAPGFVATAIHSGTLAAGPEAAGGDYYERTRRGIEDGGVPADLAAELVCFLLGDEARAMSGKLLSAQWDPWREPAFRARLAQDSALATMRRIDAQAFGALT